MTPAEKIVRLNFRALSEEESNLVHKTKEDFVEAIRYFQKKRDNALSANHPDSLEAARCYNKAIEKLEEASMWAVKGLTT